LAAAGVVLHRQVRLELTVITQYFQQSLLPVVAAGVLEPRTPPMLLLLRVEAVVEQQAIQ
jgi:hypothetical protein